MRSFIRQHWLIVLSAGVFAAGLALLWVLATQSATIYFLPRRGAAEWIIYPTPADGPGFQRVELSTKFERDFVLAEAPREASLRLCAFKRASLQINGKPLDT